MKQAIYHWISNLTVKSYQRLGLAVGLAAFLGLLNGCAMHAHDRSTGQYIDDQAIKSRIESALGDDPVYKFHNVEIASFKGSVQLSGFVLSQEQKERAAELTRQVRGVKEVTNNIIVRE